MPYSYPSLVWPAHARTQKWCIREIFAALETVQFFFARAAISCTVIVIAAFFEQQLHSGGKGSFKGRLQ